MEQRMARRTKRLWTDEEKRSICFQTTAVDVSVAQVARRYAMNANMIFKWLRDPRYAPDPEMAVEDLAADTSCFLPVEIVDRPQNEERASATDPVSVHNAIEIDIAGGHRLRIIGGYDPDALARLIRGLSV
jgi:transposase